MAQRALPPAAGQQSQQQPTGQTGGRQPPNDQVDGDLSDWVKNFEAMIPGGSHASFNRVWGAVGEHEMFMKMSGAINQIKLKLGAAARLNDEIANELKAHANKAFTERKFNAAAAMYTRALMYAVSPGVVAVLASNRAAVLLEQHLPLAALSDAQFAIQTDPSFAKAVARRGKCLRMLGQAALADQDDAAAAADGQVTSRAADADVQQVLDRALSEYDVEPSDELSASSDLPSSLVAERLWSRGPRSEEKGHHVRAGCQAAAGSTLLVERPIASVVRNEGLLCTCSLCHKQTMCLYPCAEHRGKGLRSRGLFCNVACAQESWRKFGEDETRHPFWLACPADLLLARRLTAICSSDSTSAGVKARVEELVEWSKEVNAGATSGGFESAAVCAAVAFGAIDPLRGHELVTAMRKIVPNAVPIAFTDRVTPEGAAAAQLHSYVRLVTGKGVYLNASLLNHSCDPNAFVSFRGNPYRGSGELHVRLIRPVMEGEEICAAYENVTTHVNHSTRARIRDLRAKFGFACTCGACFNNIDEPVSKEEQEHYVKAADYYQKGRRLMREGDARSAVDVLSQSLEIVMRHVCPPPRPPQFVVSKTHDSIAQAHQMLGNKAKCIEHVELSVATMARLQGDEHVDLAREYAKLATLCAGAAEDGGDQREGMVEKGVAASEKAAQILSLHYARSKALDAEVALLRGDFKAATAKADDEAPAPAAAGAAA